MRIKKTNMRNFLSIPDFISLLNLSFGFISILLAINNHIRLSAIAIIFAIIFDATDGWVAKKIGRNDEYGFGRNIDTLSDLVSFGVAPAILLYSVCRFNTPEFTPISIVISLFMIITGVLRLTRYNVISNHFDFEGFIGLPISVPAMLASAFILTGIFNINSSLAISIAFMLIFVSSILMISNIRYPKFNIKVITVVLVLILLIIIPIPISYNRIDIPASILFILTLIVTAKLFK